MKKIGILGSTGSVGSEALEIINEYKNKLLLTIGVNHSINDSWDLVVPYISIRYNI